jgi:DNA-binding PadR family transcriptional regulator
MAKLSPEPVFLGLLEAQTSYGYHLLDQFRSTEQLGRIWNLSTSQLYAILKRLEREGLIDGREEFRPDAPMRTVYWLTDAGREALFHWLHEPHPSASTRHIRTEFLSRLYIAELLGEPTTPIIDAQQAACETLHTRLVADPIPRSARVASLAQALRRREMEVILEWLETCRPQRGSGPTARRSQRP